MKDLARSRRGLSGFVTGEATALLPLPFRCVLNHAKMACSFDRRCSAWNGLHSLEATGA